MARRQRRKRIPYFIVRDVSMEAGGYLSWEM